MRILITGGSGLLGDKLAEIALKEGHEVFSTYREHVPEHGHPVKMNLLDEDSVVRAFRESTPEVVIHSAAMTDVDRCEMEKELAYKINVLGTKLVANLSKKFNSFMIYISTDYVFDGRRGMYTEEDKPNPINYYGYTKLLGERFCNDFCIVRTSVIYGAKPARGKVNFALWVIKKLSRGEKIKVIEDQFITPTLNTNLAKMLLEVAEKRIKGTLHLVGITRVSRLEFAWRIAELLGLDKKLIIPVKMEEMAWKAKRPRDSSLKASKAWSLLENKPKDLKTSLIILKKELNS